MANREMLAEAIAEAKSVRDMAIENAKSTLEEAFTPKLKEMLSAKLQEMDEEEENTNEAYSDNDPKGSTAHGNVEEGEDEIEEGEEDLNLEEILGELNEEEEDETEDETEEEDESEEDKENLELEDMEEEDLVKMIEDVISDMVEAGELEAGDGQGEDDMGDEEDETEMEVSDEEEEIALDELLREIEEEDTVNEGDYEETEDVNEEDEDLNEISLDISDTAAAISMIAPALAIATGFTVNVIKNRLRNAKNAKELQAQAEKIAREADKSDELEEAYDTVESLKEELSDLNLLNAKLLYTNKIFKNKNLTESQKVKVLGTFDKAKNVGETKLVFETLNEGLKVKTQPLKENLGRASKSTMSPKTTNPIVENETYSRWQQLAFHDSKH